MSQRSKRAPESPSESLEQQVDIYRRDEHKIKRRKRASLPPLAGKVLAVSTLMESSVKTCPENYTNVMALCQSSGAETSAQVHKRVFAVVATESAVDGETQRVRKAWKKGIPVVRVEWVQHCVNTGKFQPFESFIVPKPTSVKPKRKTIVEREEGTEDAAANPEEQWSEPLELGCCCVCHETNKTDCIWCQDCSANQDAKKTKGSS